MYKVRSQVQILSSVIPTFPGRKALSRKVCVRRNATSDEGCDCEKKKGRRIVRGDTVKNKDFQHEADGYAPIVPSDISHLIRPDDVPYDELLVNIPNPLNKNDVITKYVKINTLTKEEFIEYQKEGRIPEAYRLEDWIR